VATVDDILVKISNLTDQGKIEWTPVGRSSFRAQVDKLFLSITRDDGGEYTFTVYDDDGNPLDSVSEYFVDSFQAKLYEQARRVALKVDQNLERLSKKLDGLIRS
jgi:hypothetical protein